MKSNTAQQILDVAQTMVRNRGYSAFSYADIAKEIGIRKASIHYHFPSKEDLVKELVIRYRDNLVRKCQVIEQQKINPQEQLKKFAEALQASIQSNDKENHVFQIASTLPEWLSNSSPGNSSKADHKKALEEP